MSATLDGIDVSGYQGTVLWQTVKNAGIVFAGIKATEGLSAPDSQFTRNWQISKPRGVRRIAYHFLRPALNPWAQADHLHWTVNAAGGLQEGDSLMLDLEAMDGQSAAAVVTCAEEFARHILATTDVGLWLYTGPDFWNTQLGSPKSDVLTSCPLWVATYGPKPGVVNGWPEGPAIWQWGTRTVPGIDGEVDADTFFGDVDTFDLLASNGGRM